MIIESNECDGECEVTSSHKNLPVPRKDISDFRVYIWNILDTKKNLLHYI